MRRTRSLEHATDLDDATIAELVRKKIWYVPTINHNQHYVDRSDDAYKFSAQAKENLRNYIERNFLTAQKAYRAGALIVVGSDAVYTGFGANMQELRWFVKLGMSNEQALQSATILPAEMLGVEKSLGSLYAPNGNPQPGPKFSYKLAWLGRFARHALELYRAGVPVVLAGDYNVVPTPQDIYPTTSYATSEIGFVSQK